MKVKVTMAFLQHHLASTKNWPANAGDSFPGSRRFPGGRNSNPLQYSCLGNLMDRGVRQARVHVVSKEVDTTVTKQQQKLNNMCLTLENSADFVDLLGVSQEEERVEIIALKVYLLLGPHSMDTQFLA